LWTDKTWIFNTSIKDWLKYFFNRFTSSRYIVKGKCKKCGQCCKTILFSDENGYIKTEKDFIELQKRNKRYKMFEISGKMEETGALLFRCKSLGKDNLCKAYFFRSLYCRDYPAINPEFIKNGGTTLDNCGFYFDVNKKFEDYLKWK